MTDNIDEITIKVDGEEYRVRVEELEDGKVLVHCGNDIYELESYHPSAQSLFGKRKKLGQNQLFSGAHPANKFIFHK